MGTWFRTREEIAEYLKISRMTLSRWERIVPLTRKYPRSRIPIKTIEQVKAWYQELRSKYRPYKSYQKGRITAEK